jgi:hypothetical protein
LFTNRALDIIVPDPFSGWMGVLGFIGIRQVRAGPGVSRLEWWEGSYDTLVYTYGGRWERLGQ